jgi:hypothetical protein
MRAADAKAPARLAPQASAEATLDPSAQKGQAEANASVETAFARLVGRPPSALQRERLYRLREVLGLRDNDAFWAIVMALEHYDALFSAYPAELAKVTERSVETVRAACAAAAQQEVAALQRGLAEKVAETSAALARRLADRPVGVHRFTSAMAAVVAFGALCVHAGYAFSTRGRPFWLTELQGSPDASRALLAAVLSVPAGWMIFALLVPAAIHGAKSGWQLAADPLAERREQALGWCIVALSLLGAATCAALLLRLA